MGSSSDLLAFFTLGGIAGVCSLGWQIVTFLRDRHRQPRLRIEGAPNAFFVTESDGKERRFVTLEIKNNGRRNARTCIALAHADSGKPVQLHWADTPTGYTSIDWSVVDIPPGATHRLDVAFADESAGACLAAPSAIYGNSREHARLISGRNDRILQLTCDDSYDEKCRIVINVGQRLQDLVLSAQ